MTGDSDSEVGHDNQGFTRENVQINEKSDDRSHIEGSQAVATTAGKDNTKVDLDPNNEVDLSCGIWKFRTNIFGSKFSNLYVFSIFVAISTLFTLMIQTIFQIQLDSILKQLKISNGQAGMFDMASKIGSICTILFAGHFAKRVNIPLVVGLAGVIQGAALMVPAFLYFANPYTLPDVSKSVTTYNNITNTTTVTNADSTKYLCIPSHLVKNETSNVTAPVHHEQGAKSNEVAFNIIVIVQVVKGITDSFHAGFLPSLYVDDNTVEKTKMGIYFGIQSVITELAQPIGRQINALLTKVPIDLKHTSMNPSDPRFIAAWWLPFLIFGAGTVLFSFPVMLFPKKLLSQRQQDEALKKALVSFTVGDSVAESAGTEDTKNTDLKHENGKTAAERGNSVSSHDPRYRKLSLSPRISNGFLDATNHSSRRRSSLVPPLHGPTERRISIDGKMIFEQPIRERASVVGGESIRGSSNLIALIKDFPKAFFRVFKRPVFILIIVDIFVASIPMAGLALFRSVYITREYNVSMADAGTLTSVTQIVGQIVGTFVSGLIASRIKTKTGYVYMIIATYLVQLVTTPFFIFYGCENQDVYGHNGAFGKPVNMTGLCDCSGAKNLISCGEDGNNYLSPCYAGCLEPDQNMFQMCNRLGESNHTMKLTPGLCPTDCYGNYLLYVILHALQVLSSAMANIPRRLVILRMVDPTDRGFATSVLAFCGILVAIPSPNVFGTVIDGTCLIREGSLCNLYDRDKIRYLISGTDIGVTVFIQFTIVLTTYFFKREETQLKKKMQKEGNTNEESTAAAVKL